MALVLLKMINDDREFARQRPSGSSGNLAGGVVLFRRATSPPVKHALPATLPELQSVFRLVQSFL